MKKNWSYTITEGPHKGETLWSGRYCAVAAFIFTKFENEIYILANKRGKGCPDFQGYWTCPCGFLEANESGEDGCVRETLEETGVEMAEFDFGLYKVETDPEKSNNGNVTLLYSAVFSTDTLEPLANVEDLVGGEPNEVEEIQWINIKDIDKYQWAFNHKEILDDMIDYFFNY